VQHSLNSFVKEKLGIYAIQVIHLSFMEENSGSLLCTSSLEFLS